LKRLKALWPPLSIFGVATCIRILYNLTAGKGYIALNDAAQYERIGRNLLNNHCFCDLASVPSTGRAPLWPGIIAAVYGITGSDNVHVRLFLSLLGAGTCVVLYCFAKDLFGKRIALLTGLMGAISPTLFVYDGWLYSESLFTFFFLLFTYALYRTQKTAQIRWIIVSGIAAGLGVLTRQNEVITFGMIFLWCILVGGKRLLSWRITAKLGILITLLTIILILPWSIRNYMVSHEIIPVATGSGTILAGAYNNTVLENSLLGRRGMWVPPDMAQPTIVYQSKCCNIWGEQPEQTAYALQWITTHLSTMPKLLTLHFINIWWPAAPDGVLPIGQFPTRLSSRIIKSSLGAIPPLIFLLATAGLLATWKKKWREFLPLYLAIGLTIAQCIALYGSVRFRAPIDPMLILLVAGFFWWLGETKEVKLWLSRFNQHESSQLPQAQETKEKRT